MTEEPTEAEIEAVAHRLAYDEWPLADHHDRQAWANDNWRKYTGKARNAANAFLRARLRDETQGP